MDFEIKNHKSSTKKNKKTDKLLVFSILFLILAIILVIIYFTILKAEDKPSKKTTGKVVQEEQKKIKIVDEESNERPIAIMIDNNIGDALHAGLQDSYINYEIIVEGGLTRIMALYKDKDVPLIGPVRSSRHYFLDYSLESDAIYAHFGWSPYAEKDIKYLNVKNINGLTDDTPYWRDSKSKAPHNVFTSTEKIRSYLKNKKYSESSEDWKLLKYTPDEINLSKIDETNAITANEISINYSAYQNRSYIYDIENKYYLRLMNGKAHIDKTSNNQLNYKNIIIEKVNNINLDNEGRQDLATTGSGTGYYITNGYALPINWTKASRSAKTKYTYSNGTEIKVNDGNTFIQIVPLDSNIEIE